MIRIALISFRDIEYTTQLANAISNTEKLYLLMPRSLSEDYFNILNKNIELCLFHKPRIRYPNNLIMIQKIIKQFYRIRPDIIHLLQTENPWFNLVLPFIKRRFPLVATVHDIKPHYGDWETKRVPLINQTVRYASRVIVHGYLRI
jgi:hypothetical protein